MCFGFTVQLVLTWRRVYEETGIRSYNVSLKFSFRIKFHGSIFQCFEDWSIGRDSDGKVKIFVTQDHLIYTWTVLRKRTDVILMFDFSSLQK